MARTEIPVNVIPAYLEGVSIAPTTGDTANDNSVDLSAAPRLHVIARNWGASTVDYTIELPAGPSNFNETVSIAVSHPNAQTRAIVLDVPADLYQSGGVLHIDSADANFSDISFYAYTWQSTPRAGGPGRRYAG